MPRSYNSRDHTEMPGRPAPGRLRSAGGDPLLWPRSRFRGSVGVSLGHQTSFDGYTIRSSYTDFVSRPRKVRYVLLIEVLSST